MLLNVVIFPPPLAAGFFKGFLAMNALWLPWNLVYISLYEGGSPEPASDGTCPALNLRVL